MRKYTPNRWNYSEKAGKWVYVEIDENGNRIYTYKLEPPPEFIELSRQISKINKKLLNTSDAEENKRLFEELIKISKKMQAMRK
ncbi:MAG: hypothetical protein ACTSUN_04345 [Promethearchaeota archaeon]